MIGNSISDKNDTHIYDNEDDDDEIFSDTPDYWDAIAMVGLLITFIYILRKY